MSLVDYLISQGYLKNPIIIEAFSNIQRKDFISEEIKSLGDFDQALPIGCGQTISQPAVVAFMLELLQPCPGDKILDIGSGSGWTTALLSYIVSQVQTNEQTPKGKVYAIEIVPELVKFGKENVSKYNFVKSGIAHFICGDGSKGYPEGAPYDKILVSAESREVFQPWKEQLRIGGRIVVPIENSIWLLIKRGEDEFTKKEYPGFVFVPLVEEE
ncbi:MAG: protein-L-isoaspartate O-methyltransferase [Candidatus Pacebacteria bacterium]|nr:protein-L-isoaspartate O-methyltransferase [Candidatus Paceibacterota bacterium]